MKSILIFLILLMSTTSIYASEDENILKGVMLERISQFITYQPEGDFVICTHKNNFLYKSFEKLFQERTYQGKLIHIKNIDQINKADKCDILYIEHPDKQIVKKVRNKKFNHTLVVTDEVALLDEGFMLALYLHKSKIKFSINQKALLDAQLKVNYRLLRVASKVVNPVKN